MYMLNIFAYRSTDPKPIYDLADPIGPDNDKHLLATVKKCARVIAAWGNHGRLHNRGDAVFKLIPNMYCLGVTNEAEPKHPLYLPNDVLPFPLKPEA